MLGTSACSLTRGVYLAMEQLTNLETEEFTKSLKRLIARTAKITVKHFFTITE